MRRRLSVSKTRNVKLKIESESKLYWHYEISVFEIPRADCIFIIPEVASLLLLLLPLHVVDIIGVYFYYYFTSQVLISKPVNCQNLICLVTRKMTTSS